MNQLATVVNQTMTSREIAELTGKQHRNVLADIRKMLVEIQSTEILADYKDSKGRTYQQIILDKEQTLILVSGYNIKMRAAIVRRWQFLEEKEQRGLLRNASKEEFYPVTATLRAVRALDNKETKPHHYTNEMNMINRIILGCTAKQYRINEDVPDSVAIRDTFTPLELKAVTSLQRADTVFLEMGLDYEERKQKLQDIFDRNFNELFMRAVMLEA